MGEIELTCGICYEPFEAPRNAMVFTGCGHTICSDCLSHVNKCPFCNNSDVTAVKNIMIMNLVEEMKNKNPNPNSRNSHNAGNLNNSGNNHSDDEIPSEIAFESINEMVNRLVNNFYEETAQQATQHNEEMFSDDFDDFLDFQEEPIHVNIASQNIQVNNQINNQVINPSNHQINSDFNINVNNNNNNNHYNNRYDCNDDYHNKEFLDEFEKKTLMDIQSYIALYFDQSSDFVDVDERKMILLQIKELLDQTKFKQCLEEYTSNGKEFTCPEGVCSFLVMGKAFVQQKLYQCLTCDFIGDKVVCEACAKKCHAGHALSQVFTGFAYCDCGDNLQDFHCRCCVDINHD
ncbi:hypothetical protein TRFO_21496 [Tritrichomonas foetus]|uniref:RING-type domain-containing protein n=1 Tax=Tritrichomonas foetus TaxID=1144522 RepID=A0A1J4KEH2_9EUKA|nr:hypothetical protein TRFO_21496 [Tritrichomonas foetus]|eukprot:OHT09603.1 hypothetical protein TRFO_21496 [Tritrichomonas foetus]